MQSFITAALLALAVTVAQADTITVCWDGSGDYETIQPGIDAAQDGDEVVVCDGTYTGDENKRLDFHGKQITVRSENGPESCIIDCEYHGGGFYFEGGETAASVAEGFTITNGNVTLGGGGIRCVRSNPTLVNCILSRNRSYRRGGGMYNEQSSPKLIKCTFSDNRTEHGEHWDGGGGMYNKASSPTLIKCAFSGNLADVDGHYLGGGGMYNDQYSSPTLTDCIFSENKSRQNGGGMYNDRFNDRFISPTLINCTFSGNLADGEGGGMYNDGSKPTLTNCTFSGNLAWGGGGMFNERGRPTLTNCTFSGNSAYYGGGGMYNCFGRPTLTNCTFSGNSAEHNGGGMEIWATRPNLINCTFNDNSAGSDGGGMDISRSRPSLINCTFNDNSAGSDGGGMHNYRGWVTLTNCIFSGNWAEHNGGGMESWRHSSASLINCTLTGNSAGSEGGGIYNPRHAGKIRLTNCVLWGNSDAGGMDESAQVHGKSKRYQISYSCIQGCEIHCPGDHNIGDDPLFVTGPLGDYYLSQVAAGQEVDSPCIDAGSDTAENLALDWRTTRTDEVADTDVVDMGYHYLIRFCGPINRLESRCKDGWVSATVYSDLPEGAKLTLSLDGCRHKTVTVNANGKAKVTWDKVDPGEHDICIKACRVCKNVSCN